MLTTYHYARLRSTGEIYAAEFRGEEIISVCGPVPPENFKTSFPAEGLRNCPKKSVGWLKDQEYDWVAPGELNPSQDQQSPRSQLKMPEGGPGKDGRMSKA